MDGLRFRSQKEKHELSHLYEAKIKNMGNAGRNGGEYYTPRPLIRAMIRVVKPRIGERVYDGAVGSAGFLCESHDYMRHGHMSQDGGDGGELTTSDLRTLQTRTFYGKEKKSLAYVIAIMNMILHGIDAPNILHTNTLAENISDIQEKDRFDVILANPPFGGKERKEVQQNFPIKTGETAFLFLQHFIKSLKAGGRAGVVIKNTFLSNSDNASRALRKELLENCNLHTILDCPSGTFLGAGVKTVVLFFEKGAPTRKVWFYQLDPGRNMGKTNALNDDDLKEFVELQATFAELGEILVGGRGGHRSGDLRSVGEEPQQGRGSAAARAGRDPRRDCRPRRRKRGNPRRHPGDAMREGWETRETRRCVLETSRLEELQPKNTSVRWNHASLITNG